MLSDKIDLTENRDFGGDGTNFQVGETFIRLMDDIMLISPTERFRYRHLYAYIFGKKYYKNEYYSKIKTDTSDEIDTHNQCQCCGKILVPWNLTYWLCKECSYRVKMSIQNNEGIRTNMVKKCPWTKYDYPNEKDILQTK